MTVRFTDLYHLYAEQITRLLKDKSEMFSIGFRNGVISTKGPSESEAFKAAFAPQYDLGYREGFNYAIYKMALHNVVTKVTEPSK
jgi:hypothetical protein